MLGVDFDKVGVVAVFDKDVVSVHPAIMDVIVVAWFKGDHRLHSSDPRPTWSPRPSRSL